VRIPLEIVTDRRCREVAGNCDLGDPDPEFLEHGGTLGARCQEVPSLQSLAYGRKLGPVQARVATNVEDGKAGLAEQGDRQRMGKRAVTCGGKVGRMKHRTDQRRCRAHGRSHGRGSWTQLKMIVLSKVSLR